MPQQNVDIVRKVFDFGFVDGDLDSALELMDPGCVMDWSDSRSPYSGVYRGHAEIREAWQGWNDAWDEWRPEILEAIEVDGDTVVIVTLVNARGKGSGVPVQARGASVWTVRDGRVAYAKLCQNKAEALEAAAALH